MKTIVMDSANKYLVVALYEDEKCLASLQEEGNRKAIRICYCLFTKALTRKSFKNERF